MADKEKVIKGLQCCSVKSMCTCELQGCPYYPDKYNPYNECTNQLTAGVLALLKEQEALEKRLDDSDRINVVRCSDCIYWQPPTYQEQEDGSTIGHCTAALDGQQTDAYWFCADGTR